MMHGAVLENMPDAMRPASLKGRAAMAVEVFNTVSERLSSL